MTTVAIIGLGEAGGLYARGMRDAGFTVAGFDPYTRLDAEGIAQASTVEGAVSDATLVVSLVGARAALNVGADAIAAMAPGAVFADFNTGSPDLKSTMSEVAQKHQILFADVAVLAPVPRGGVLTPLMASGDGADRFAQVMKQTGAPVESIGGAAGDAAGRKLLRSVFMKGLAAVILESDTAAESAGQREWLRDQIAAEFSGDPHALIERLITGSREHADRRTHETEDAAAYLDSLGAPNWSTKAAHAWLSQLRDESRSGAGSSPASRHGKDTSHA
ncbi:NAD(P)-dependent oxidoreductase [Paramicrobacterium chengjingii]|uniref:NAD(P)-dependent oxidoreductase n=1 Tax=Paramicrobacterium chengjingii TaxID=2769067 RepID=A0ABX6YGW5_9MICO|nr:NAD(P)-binding domain-containing protein [Microbacterium chengjingii]QPZ38038.1 NAD(P)-dependent oxidoreductase [Microbacterium chengjingii]